MADLNLKYYTQIDHYSDGDVEEDILEFVQNGWSLTDIPKDRRSYACAYHLAQMRENIITWYPMKKTDKVLEIGSGCGGVTGALCEMAGSVTSVELSKRRATINYERHKSYDNLEILVGNFNDMQLKPEYDYVVLIGVFEYAMSFTKGKTPYHDFLKKMMSYVKPGGKILLAIENRLGEKYFAGAYEDHTDTFFLGLNQYEGNDQVRTFSKKELTDIFNECGIQDITYYYPYPDYKFPSEIYTDATINSSSFGREYMNLYQKRCSLFSEEQLIDALKNENIMDRFANSFFVEAVVGQGQKEDKVLYAKLNSLRKPEFRIATIIYQGVDEEKYVIKKPLNVASVPHVEKIATKSRMNTMEELINLPGKYKDGVIRYEFLKDSNLDSIICALAQKEKKNEIVKIITEIRDILKSHSNEVPYQTEDFEKIFGTATSGKEKDFAVCPANIDCICDNIICREDGYVLIDGEWIFDVAVPINFIVWRLVNELYTQHKNLLTPLIQREEVYDILGITREDGEVYVQWAKHFAEEYVGRNPLAEYGAEIRKLNLQELINTADREKALEESKKKIPCMLFFDTGDGFSENDGYHQFICEENGEFTVTFEIDKYASIKNLRFDPLEGRGLKMQILKINGKDLEDSEILGNNAEFEKNGKQIFISGDPQYYLDPELPENGVLEIHGRIKVMPEEETFAYYRRILGELDYIKNSRQYRLLRKAKLIKNKRKE